MQDMHNVADNMKHRRHGARRMLLFTLATAVARVLPPLASAWDGALGRDGVTHMEAASPEIAYEKVILMRAAKSFG